jgi:hypothetical protein
MVILGFFLVGEFLIVVSQPLRFPKDLNKPPSPAYRYRPGDLPCLKPSLLLVGTERSVKIKIRPSQVDLDLSLSLPINSQCAETFLGGFLEGADAKASFIRAAFGEVTFAGDPPRTAEIGSPFFLKRRQSGFLTVRFQVHRRDVTYPNISLARNTNSSPLVDRIEIRWEGVRIYGISPFPSVLRQNRALISAASPSSIARFYVRAEPLDSSTSGVIRDSSREFLQRLGRSLRLSILSRFLHALAIASPLLMFLYFASREPHQPRFASRLSAGTKAIVSFHLLLVFFASLAFLWWEDWWEACTKTLSQTFYRVVFLSNWTSLLPAGLVGWLRSLSPDHLGEGLQIISFVAFGLIIPPIVRHQLGQNNTVSIRRRRWFPLGSILLSLVAIGLAVLIFLKVGAKSPLWAYLLPAGVLVFFVLWFLFSSFYRLVAASPPHPSLAPMASLSVLAAVAAIQIPFKATIETILWLLVSLAFGYVLIQLLLEIIWYLVGDLPIFAKARANIRKPGWRLLILLLALPLTRLVFVSAPWADESTILSFGLILDPFLTLLWLLGVGHLLYEQGKKSLEINRFSRMAGLLGISIVLFNTSTRWLYLPVTFLIGWLGLNFVLVRPATTWNDLKPLMEPILRTRARLIAAILRVNTAERGYRGFRQKQIEKLSKGDLEFSTYDKEVQAKAEELTELRKKAAVGPLPAQDVALLFGPYPTAWENGVYGARCALMFASPWIVLGVAELLRGARPQNFYPLWPMAYDVIFTLLKWTVFGFLLGYFFPYIRGKSGLGKGLFVFLASTLPVLPMAAIYNSSWASWQPMLFWFLQTFIHCMLLGLFAFDYAILKQARNRDWRLLFEVHGFPLVGASISSILIALGTAITTLLTSQLSGLAGLALRFALPEGVQIPTP